MNHPSTDRGHACDWLVFGAHPDDAELGMGGTILKAVQAGRSVVVVDWTRGELGTRGDGDLRVREASEAAAFMGLKERVQLDLGDGYFEGDRKVLDLLVRTIRRYRPSVVWGNTLSDRHPDHGRAAAILRRAVFMAGLPKVLASEANSSPEFAHLTAWRPQLLGFYIQDHYRVPHLVVDITAQGKAKMELLACYSSQFYQAASTEPETPISRQDFLPFVEARSREMGRLIGVELGEGFVLDRPLSQRDMALLV
jgi:bacillithiol biosynthesis deacetylase BshB1